MDEGPAESAPNGAAAADKKSPGEKSSAEEGVPAALPGQEMGFSESTLHWLEDGEQAGDVRPTGPVTLPSYDPTAPIAGRRRTILVIGGAAAVALVVAIVFYYQGKQHRAASPREEIINHNDPGRELTRRAEAAFEGGRLQEALELGNLALVADARIPDAHYVVGRCEQARGRLDVARDHYRKYLELAPIGKHAGTVRAALAKLPP